jgi:hypothetical protein
MPESLVGEVGAEAVQNALFVPEEPDTRFVASKTI